TSYVTTGCGFRPLPSSTIAKKKATLANGKPAAGVHWHHRLGSCARWERRMALSATDKYDCPLFFQTHTSFRIPSFVAAFSTTERDAMSPKPAVEWNRTTPYG